MKAYFQRITTAIDLDDAIDVKREQQNCRINQIYIAYHYTFHKMNNDPIECTFF